MWFVHIHRYSGHRFEGVSIRMGWGGWIFFRWEPVSSLSAHACQILALSDGRVEKIVFQVYRLSRWHWFLSSHCLTNYGVFRFVRSLLRNNCCTANCDFERCLRGTHKHILNCYRLWQEQTVALLPAPDGSGYTYNATMQKMLLYMRTTVKQQNVMRFFGVTTIKGVLFSVSEYCSKGVLQDILQVIQTRGFYICYVYMLLFFFYMSIL